ncbi:MAG: sigma 54-interacting transcriptional regulator [Pseudomonadota bacterium]
MMRAVEASSDWSALDARDFELLRQIIEGTASAIGNEYFEKLVENLAAAIGTNHAFISEFTPPRRIRTLAFWSGGRIIDNLEYDLPGTPCEEVFEGGFCYYPSGLQQRYPETEPGIESYIGVPLKARDGSVLGHLCVLDEKPLADEPRRLAMFRICAIRAAAELDRLHQDRDLNDLFDEAPIAYVHEGLDTRFIRANRAALRILGLRADQVSGTFGRSFIPDTPEARRRLQEAFDSVGRGTDTSGVVLELQRRDDGRQIFIQWWSKPARDGDFTRTMFVDITERVLMEQEQARLKEQNSYLIEEIKSVHNFEEIVGASNGLVRVLDNVRRVAPAGATVLITGESGTGKELIARAIHSASARADKPFVKVNCAALPTSLVESELFGHERGAFSGAIQRRVGRFELANGGTIFLDEIGEVPMDVQVKLLRVLQEREFERIGSNQTIRTDVRVIAATNRDLLKSIKAGDFRADLYYRLNVFPIHMPPLRERREDIPLLVRFFVQKYASRIGRRVDSIAPEAMNALVRYPWPGNIRELENIIERALILSSSPELSIDAELLAVPADVAHDAPAHVNGLRLAAALSGVPATESNGGASDEEDNALDSVQRQHILTTLRDTNWVIEGSRGAAARLGMKPGTLRHRMKKLGIARSATL